MEWINIYLIWKFVFSAIVLKEDHRHHDNIGITHMLKNIQIKALSCKDISLKI